MKRWLRVQIPKAGGVEVEVNPNFTTNDIMRDLLITPCVR